MDVKEVI